MVIVDFGWVIWRWKLTFVCDSWFLGCNQGANVNCTPVPFQHPLIRLRFLWFFVKYLLWLGALLLGWNEGRVLLSYGIFQTSWVKPAPYACQPKNQAAKTPRAKNRFFAGPQTKSRTDRKLPVLYYISYGYVFPHTNHHSKKSARAVTIWLLTRLGSSNSTKFRS